MSYKDYLQSNHWKEFRKSILKERRQCQICSRKNVLFNIHHKNYKCLGKETGKDVIVLCQDCHHKLHQKDKWKKIYAKGGELDFTGASEKSKKHMEAIPSIIERKCSRCGESHKLFYMIMVNGSKATCMMCPNSKPRTEFIPFARDYRNNPKKLRQQEKRKGLSPTIL